MNNQSPAHYLINEFITGIVAPHGSGFQSFTLYEDAEDRFVTVPAFHLTFEEAEARILVLALKYTK